MGTELLDAIVSWRTFLVALLVFGFAPGALLRLIVLAFPRDDPRRRELLAELHAVPRLERPFWVVEQLEVALFEGIRERLVWAATGRIIDRWHLGSGVQRHRESPETFQIPDQEAKQAIEPGVVVKLMFEMSDGWGERMWVEVVAVKRRHLVGALRNHPVGIPRLDWGDRVRFNRDHIIDIDWEDDCLCEPMADDPEGDDTIGVDPDCNGPDTYFEPVTEDPEDDHIAWVHSGCNGRYEPAAGTPELSPPPESSATQGRHST
jgi:Uncharacterized protein conserved in bacteria (DUF2314)